MGTVLLIRFLHWKCAAQCPDCSLNRPGRALELIFQAIKRIITADTSQRPAAQTAAEAVWSYLQKTLKTGRCRIRRDRFDKRKYQLFYSNYLYEIKKDTYYENTQSI